MRRISLFNKNIHYPYACESALQKVFLFLTRMSVTIHELIYTTCRVNQLRLTGIERVRRARNFKFYNRISFALKFNCVVGFAS